MPDKNLAKTKDSDLQNYINLDAEGSLDFFSFKLVGSKTTSVAQEKYCATWFDGLGRFRGGVSPI